MPLASPSTAQHHAAQSSSRTGLAIIALILGVLGAGLALVVAFLGVLLPYAWYVVVGLAVLTLALGMLSVGRRHHRSPAGGVLAWLGTVGGIVALVLGVWGVTNIVRGTTGHPHQVTAAGSPVLHSTTTAKSSAPSPPPSTSTLSGPQLGLGQQYTMDGVQVEVDGPETFHPSSIASTTDGSAITRAVKFTVIITNNTPQPLPATGVLITGQVNGQQVSRIYDGSTVPNLNSDIPPGQSVSVPVAFNLPSAHSQLLIGLQPQSMTGTSIVYYGGTV